MENNNYGLAFKPGKILELGGGDNPLHDRNGKKITFNVDYREGKFVDLVHNLDEFPWPLKDESFENVYCSYAIEHMSWKDVDTFIDECYRILKSGGKAVFVTSNTYEQAKRMVNEGVNRGTIELLFGSQEFPNHGGCHKTGWSPEYAEEVFKNHGFQVIIRNHPISKTDMIIEVLKMEKKQEKDDGELFEREYFEDGTYGYKNYRDFATHYTTSRIILNSTPPVKSFLDVGGGRGYVARIIENTGVPVTVMDISRHCRDTRVVENFVLHDARKTPWPFKDKEFDLLFTINFLEHIDEEHLDDILHEIDRVSERSMHGVHMNDMPIPELDEDRDITHKISQPKSWWEKRFQGVIPNHKTVIEHPRFLEYDEPEKQPPVSAAPQIPDELKKISLGSFLDMFYYGWINIDILDLAGFAKSQAYSFRQHDVRNGLPYDEGSVDAVFSSHLLEHLNRDEGVKLLHECFRVMKPGAVLRFSVPDTKEITKKYLDGKIDEYRFVNTGVEKCRDDADAYYNLLLAGHKTVYDEDALKKTLVGVGFVDVERVSPFTSKYDVFRTQTVNCHPTLSCVVEAKKPASMSNVSSYVKKESDTLEVITV